MRVFAVSGTSGTGKTTIIEGLIRTLKEKGFSVCTAKSSKEDLQAPEGSDTWRHMRAGAEITVFLGPESTVSRRRGKARIREVFRGDEADFLLIEGKKGVDLPRLWCIGGNKTDVNEIPSNTRAVVIWEGSKGTVEGYDGIVLSSHELSSLSDIIIESAIDIELIDF